MVVIDALRALAGDALIAVGEAIRGGSDNLDPWADPDGILPFGSMESDGPDQTKPIPFADVRAALNELPDSQLLQVAAAVIPRWNPLVEALRDRAAQLLVHELDDVDRPHPTPARPGAPLTSSPRRGE